MKIHQCQLFLKTNIDVTTIQQKQFPANYTIELEGSISTYVGIVLQGSIDVIAYTPSGNTIKINTLEEGMIYGDVLLYGAHNSYPGNLITKEPTTIAYIENSTIKTYLETNPMFLKNFMVSLSGKVNYYNTQFKLLAQDTIRDKILYFLHTQQIRQKTNQIHLHMSKQDLALKLNVQRPSLSRELIKMKEEGLIDYDRWTITILH